MSEAYQKVIDAGLRLRILEVLEMSGGLSMYAEQLYDFLNDLKHNVAHADVMRNIKWLAEQRLVGVEMIAGAYLIKLTQRGLDVQAGRARVPGVARPRPEG